MEDLYLYLEDMVMGPNGEELYEDIMILQNQIYFYEVSVMNELNK
jgi:hypothetical protein